MNEPTATRALTLSLYLNALALLESTGKTYVSREIREVMKQLEDELKN
ncbi:MAG TPA: hypothetical protein VFK27_02970 [Bacillales bacterium]|nr:hypothetical protein [Bacillales bacterium]